MRITLTKEDGQNAGPWIRESNCLLATTFKRLGYTNISVGNRRVLCTNGSPKRFDYTEETLELLFSIYGKNNIWKSLTWIRINKHLPVEIELTEVTR